MRLLTCTLLLSTFALAACEEPVPQSNEPGLAARLPDSIIAIAAPNQDLNTVRVMPEDGCLWYRHTGPVETTLLPLRTREGRPICTQPVES